MQLHQHISFVVHALQNPVEFVCGGHHLIISLFIRISVECPGGIDDERVEKNMCYFADLDRNQCSGSGFIVCYGFRYKRIRRQIGIGLKQRERCFVIITECQKPGLL